MRPNAWKYVFLEFSRDSSLSRKESRSVEIVRVDDSEGSGAGAGAGADARSDRDESYEGKLVELAAVEGAPLTPDRDTEGDDDDDEVAGGAGALSANCLRLDIILFVISSGLSAACGDD